MKAYTKEKAASRAAYLNKQEPHYHCSEAFVIAVGDYLFGSIDERTQKISTAFGGGIGLTELDICGAFSGGIILIGSLYGRITPEDNDELWSSLAVKYRNAFVEQFGGIVCHELRAERYGSSHGRPCYTLVKRAVEIFIDIIEEVKKLS